MCTHLELVKPKNCQNRKYNHSSNQHTGNESVAYLRLSKWDTWLTTKPISSQNWDPTDLTFTVCVLLAINHASFCNLIVLKNIAKLTLFIFLFDYLKYRQMVPSSQCTYFFHWVYYIRASFCNFIFLKDIAISLFEILPNFRGC